MTQTERLTREELRTNFKKLTVNSNDVYNKSFTTKKLVESIKYFINTPENRCSSRNGCYYSYEGMIRNDGDEVRQGQAPTKGCAVGMLLSEPAKKWADESMRDVSTLIEDNAQEREVGKTPPPIPKYISLNVGLFSKLQSWHDSDGNFDYDENKLSDRGIRILLELAVKYDIFAVIEAMIDSGTSIENVQSSIDENY